MIRIRLLINKEDLPNYLSNPDVVKIELANGDNRRLKDKAKYDVKVYFKIPRTVVQDSPINVIMGACAKAIKDNDIEKFLTDNDHAFLNGIQSQRIHGWLKPSMITELQNIEEKHKLSLNISKEIIKLVEKYNI